MAYIPIYQQFSRTVDAKSVNAYLLGTPGKNFIVTGVQYLLASVNTLTILPTASVGKTSALYVDISAAALLTNLVSANDVVPGILVTASGYVAAGTGIFCNISIAATATVCSLTIIVTGYYLN